MQSMLCEICTRKKYILSVYALPFHFLNVYILLGKMSDFDEVQSFLSVIFCALKTFCLPKGCKDMVLYSISEHIFLYLSL